jgi:hypothetical protein
MHFALAQSEFNLLTLGNVYEDADIAIHLAVGITQRAAH